MGKEEDGGGKAKGESGGRKRGGEQAGGGQQERESGCGEVWQLLELLLHFNF